MRNNILTLLILSLILTSCNTTKEIRQRNLSSLDRKFSAIFVNQSTKKEKSKNQITILELLKIDESVKIDSVKLEIQADGQLKIEYEHKLKGRKIHFYKGKFKKHYYQVFFQRDQIILPPIYWVTHIERLRFGISKDNLLIINEYTEHSGMILLFSGGSGSNSQYSFKN